MKGKVFCFFTLFAVILTCGLFSALNAEPKHGIYWQGDLVCQENTFDQIALRGFSHVFCSINKSNAFYGLYNHNLNIILETAGWENIFNLSYTSPFGETKKYNDHMSALHDSLTKYHNELIGIVDDIEVHACPVKGFDLKGNIYGQQWYDTYEQKRIGPAPLGRVCFRDFPNTDFHKISNLSLKNILFNGHIVVDSQIIKNACNILGRNNTNIRWAQTFRPNQSRITRIDLFIKRNLTGNSDWPKTDIKYYLTKVGNSGAPDIMNILGNTERVWTMGKEEFDCKPNSSPDDFIDIDTIRLFFDPDSIGLLSLDEPYALVLECDPYNIIDNELSYYSIAVNNCNPYPFGSTFICNSEGGWTNYINDDAWFKVYGPTLEKKSNSMASALNDDRIVYIGKTNNQKIAQTFIGNELRIGSILAKTCKSTASGLGNMKVSIQKVNVQGEPSGEIIAQWRVASNNFATFPVIKEFFLPGYINGNHTYAIVFEYEGTTGENYYYEFNKSSRDVYNDGIFFVNSNGSWIPYSNNDLYFEVFGSLCDLDIGQLHRDWVDFQTECQKWVLQDYANIVNTVNVENGVDMGVYIYSAYQDQIYKGQTMAERYSLDWNKFSTTGIKYAVCGIGNTMDITPTLNALGDNVILIGGVQTYNNQTTWNDVYATRAGGLEFWCDYGLDHDNPDLIVPVFRRILYPPDGYFTNFNYPFEIGWDGCWRIKKSNVKGRVYITNPQNPDPGIECLALDSDILPPDRDNPIVCARFYCDLSLVDHIIINFSYKLKGIGNDSNGLYFSNDAGLHWKLITHLPVDEDWEDITLQITNSEEIYNFNNHCVLEFRYQAYAPYSTAGLLIEDFEVVGDKYPGREIQDNDDTGFYPLITHSQNPFRTSCAINLPKTDGASTIRIYDAAGKLVRSYDFQGAPVTVHWNGTDQAGRSVPQGVYIVRYESNGERITDKIVYLK